ncbi:MAG: glycosyltransferase family 4 protein, partial [Gammaproteobacteria bacterium]|nr:glycosyltransferase family 4 protein [Gammaproteobacteria bacterium]
MKIWIPSLRYHSGASVYTKRLVRMLLELGYEVEHSSFSKLHQLFPYLLKFKRPKAKPDIVIADSLTGFMFRGVGKKLIIIEHHCIFDPVYTPYRSWQQLLVHELLWRYYEKKSLHSADHVICVSEYTARSVQQIFGKLPVKVILNGIETELFVPSKKQDKTLQSPIRLLFIGNLSRRKGADLLPTIMQTLGNDFQLRYT